MFTLRQNIFRISLTSLIVAFAVVQVASQRAQAAKPPSGPATIYVDASNTGDPREDGSSRHPFDTIQEGIDAAVAEDTVLVKDGTYNETPKNSSDWGTPTSYTVLLVLKPYITVKAENLGGAIIDGQNFPTLQQAVFAQRRGSHATNDYEPVDGVVFEGFVIRNFQGTGVYIVNMPNGDPVPAIGNVLKDLTIEGPGNGIGLSSYYAPSRFVGNTVSNVSLAITGRGSTTTARYTMEDNVVFNVEQGIDYGGWTGGDIFNNVITDFTVYGINVYYGGGNIINNTVADGAGVGMTNNNGHGAVVENNVVANCLGGGVDRWYAESPVDYNLYWNNGPTGNEHRADEFGDPVLLSANEFVDDPFLTADHHLGDLSPAIDAGVDWSGLLCVDFDGDPRCPSNSGDGLFDIGADEFAGGGGAVCSDYTDQNSCNVDPTCRWRKKQGDCVNR